MSKVLGWSGCLGFTTTSSWTVKHEQVQKIVWTTCIVVSLFVLILVGLTPMFHLFNPLPDKALHQECGGVLRESRQF